MRLPKIVFKDKNRIEIDVGSDTANSIFRVKASKNPPEVHCDCSSKTCNHLKYCKSILDSFLQKKEEKNEQ